MVTHNIPEGLAVGVLFGASARNWRNSSGAGSGQMMEIENFPEGFAVAMPLEGQGESL